MLVKAVSVIKHWKQPTRYSKCDSLNKLCNTCAMEHCLNVCFCTILFTCVTQGKCVLQFPYLWDQSNNGTYIKDLLCYLGGTFTIYCQVKKKKGICRIKGILSKCTSSCICLWKENKWRSSTLNCEHIYCLCNVSLKRRKITNRKKEKNDRRHQQTIHWKTNTNV